MIHELKIESSYFEAVKSGDKTFEIRRNDRDFQKGDKVVLQEVTGDHLYGYTGNEIEVIIKYVTNYEQKGNYVVFGFEAKEQKEK